MAKESMQDAKQAGKNGMPLSPKGKGHLRATSKGKGRHGSRHGGKK